MKKINTPLTKEICKTLKAGEMVYLSGTIYTARDAAHKRINEMLDKNMELPIDLNNNIIYYVGPTPTPKGKIFGSAGPTTSMRMDLYAPRLYDLGIIATIGKGYRNENVVQAIQKNSAVYFVTVGGAGALLGKCIKKAEIIAFEDLGCEAIQRLEVENFPLTVAIDSNGNNVYKD